MEIHTISSRLFKAHIWCSKPTFLASFLQLAAKPSSKKDLSRRNLCTEVLLHAAQQLELLYLNFTCDREYEREIMPGKLK